MWDSPGAEAPPPSEDPEAQGGRLTLRVSVDEDRSEITVDGELDLATIHLLQHALYDAAWGPRVVRIDLRRVTFMDLAALRVLREAHTRLRGLGRRLVLVVAPGRRPRVMSVLSLAAGLTVEEHPEVEAT